MEKIKYIRDIPRLVKEFDTERNTTPIESITTGSGRQIFWVCKKQHKWQADPFHRVSGRNCPYCAGIRPIKGETDLATLYPDVAKEWHPTKNGDAKPEDFLSKSGKRMWWICSVGHEYETKINVRTAHNCGCPYCFGRYAIKGETDLETLRPEIAKEWHPTKNGNIRPDSVTVGSSNKYWWVCNKGHEYEMKVYDRTKKTKAHLCPYCARKKPIAGETDFGSVCKEAVAFWDYDKNDSKPSDFLPNSVSNLWFKCDKGHSWQSRLVDLRKNPKCPYCSKVLVEKGVNSLKDLYPEVSEMWNYEKNSGTDIDTVHVGSSLKMYWWICDKGHEWISCVSKIVSARGNGCPFCAGHLSKYSI